VPLPSSDYSNIGSISHHFRYTTTYNFKLSIKNCDQTVAYGDMVTIEYWQPIGSRQRSIRGYYRRPPTTYRLATIHPLRTTTTTMDDRGATTVT